MSAGSASTHGPLSEIMSATADIMRAELRRTRASFDHNGLIGTANEEIVAAFMNDQLPASLRAVAGKIVDRDGNRSRQVDVIVYDTSRTPLLFASSQKTQHLVPCEGVVAVIEVKTRLTRKEMNKSVVHCASVKRLNRTAYLPSLISREFKLYGQSWLTPPVYYTIFSFESDGLYAGMLNDEVGQEYPLHEQIDSVVCLDRGLCLNATVEVGGIQANTSIETHFSATPDPESIRAEIRTSNALVVWYGMITSTVLERIPVPTIDITAYLRSELTVAGNVEAGAAAALLYERVRRQFAEAIEIAPELLVAMQNPSIMTPANLYGLMRHPMYAFNDKLVTSPELRKSIQERIDSARTQDLSEWLQRWFPGQDPNSPIAQ